MEKNHLVEVLNDPDFGLDGVWSALTQSLMKIHSTDKVELNKWWAITPQNWKCPSCERTKRQIARLNSSGILLAKLVSHHDHIKEALDEFDNEISDAGGTSTIRTQLRDYLEKLAYGFLTRFEPTIVCEDCNNIEPEIRKRLGLPSYLSLTPLEIQQFRAVVDSAPSSEIRFEADRLQQWCQGVLKLIQLSISEFCADIHTRHAKHTYKTRVVEDSAVGTLRHKLGMDLECKPALLDEFLELSTAKPQEMYSKKSLLPIPAQEQFNSYRHRHPHRQEHWGKLESIWRCPICERSKFECFRSSPKSPLIFNGNVFPKNASQVFIGAGEEAKLHICQDCNDFPQGFRKYLKKTRRLDVVALEIKWFLNADIVREGILARPHQRHFYDFEKARCLLDSMLQVMPEDIELDF